jgi:hypothetical protein
MKNPRPSLDRFPEKSILHLLSHHDLQHPFPLTIFHPFFLEAARFNDQEYD